MSLCAAGGGGWRAAGGRGHCPDTSVRLTNDWLPRQGKYEKRRERSQRPGRLPTAPPTVMAERMATLRSQRLTGRRGGGLVLPLVQPPRVMRQLALNRLKSFAVPPPLLRNRSKIPGRLLLIDIKRPGMFGQARQRAHADRRETTRDASRESAHVSIRDAIRVVSTQISPAKRKNASPRSPHRLLDFTNPSASSCDRTCRTTEYSHSPRRSVNRAQRPGLKRIQPCTPRTNGKVKRRHPDGAP